MNEKVGRHTGGLVWRCGSLLTAGWLSGCILATGRLPEKIHSDDPGQAGQSAGSAGGSPQAMAGAAQGGTLGGYDSIATGGGSAGHSAGSNGAGGAPTSSAGSSGFAGAATGITACGSANACVLPGSRDVAEWPFDACSPWNHPIGSGASYQVIDNRPTSPSWRKYGSWIHSWNDFGCVESSDNSVSIEGSGPAHNGKILSGSASFDVSIPDALQIPSDSDGHVYFVRADRSSSLETYHAQVSGNDLRADWLVRNPSLTDDGVMAPGASGYRGVRAYGGSALAGVIRHGELKSGIHHAIAFKAPQQVLNKNGPSGGGVWPASSIDGDSGNYAQSGNLYMGSLLALPPGADTSFITDPLIQSLAAALRDYGGYVVDRGADLDPNGFLGCVGYLAELNDQDAIAIANEYEQIGRLSGLLQVVVNNGPDNRGGGGTPRACFAPPAGN